VFPSGDVALGNAWMAEFCEFGNNLAVGASGAEEFVDFFADFDGEAGDFADASYGRV
jgi:hypothetical protein